MSRFYLNVPFNEKELAKTKGARWDLEKKKWFVPHGANSIAFIKWISELTLENNYNLYSEHYFIAESTRHCWRCEAIIPVYAICLPRGHKQLEVIDVNDPNEWESGIVNEWYKSSIQDSVFMELYDRTSARALRWHQSSAFTPIPSIIKISAVAEQKIQQLSSSYHLGYSRAANGSYYANHCPKCKRLQGDFMLHEEPGGVFFPISTEQASRIKLHTVKDPIFLNGSIPYTTEDFFESMIIMPNND